MSSEIPLANSTKRKNLPVQLPGPKKLRTVTPMVPSAATSGVAPKTTTSSAVPGATILTYLSAIQDRLSLRVKTQVQLKISSLSNPTKTCRFVVLGSASWKKLGQLCAFLTGHSNDYAYHSQKGKSLKGSFFQISQNGEKLWLGEKALAKKAAAAGAAHVVDKTIKVVQVFQGLISHPKNGMTFDSPAAQALAAAKDSVVWNSGNSDDCYAVTVEGIVANKCTSSSEQSLPRIVTDDFDNARRSTAFGMNIHRANTHLRGNRQGLRMLVHVSTSQAEVNRLGNNYAARPLCDSQGRLDEMDFFFDEDE